MASIPDMMKFGPAMFAAFTAAWAMPAIAIQAEGRIGTLPHGQYICSLPGDADGAAWKVIEGSDFTIDNASAYYTEQGRGIYLLVGDRVTFTRGPMRGLKLLRVGSNALVKLDRNDKPTRERCVRQLGTG